MHRHSVDCRLGLAGVGVLAVEAEEFAVEVGAAVAEDTPVEAGASVGFEATDC